MVRYRIVPSLESFWMLKGWPYKDKTEAFRVDFWDNLETIHLCDILDRHLTIDEDGSNLIDMVKLKIFMPNGKEIVGWQRTSFVELYFERFDGEDFDGEQFDGRYNSADGD